MNKLIRRLPLPAKLMLIGIIPLLFLIFLTFQVYNEKTERLKLFDNYKNYMAESANINGLIDAMQEERKFSFDYAMTKTMRKELLLQRPKTDRFIQKLIKSDDPAIAGFEQYTKLGELNDIRSKVDNSQVGPDAVMHFYSNTVFRLNTLNTIPPANTPYLQPVYKDLMAQKILSEMITYLGIIRSNIYNVLHTKQYMVETLIGTIGAHDMYNSYDLELKAKATPSTLEQYKAITSTSALKPTSEYMETLFKRFTFDESLTAAEWWKISDEGVNELRNFQSAIWKNLNQKINELHEKEERSRSKTLLLLIIALISVVIVVSYILWVISCALRELQAAARKLSNGETGVSINAESNDAIGFLAQSISEIDANNQILTHAAIAIGKGNFNIALKPRSDKDQLSNAIVQMKNDLFQYSQNMEELVANRTEQLARSNEDLQQFAHVASHDLKEPLRKITMLSNILNTEQKNVLSEKGKLYLEKIERSSVRMSEMIEGILAYSTVGVSEPTPETVDLNIIMEGVVSDLELTIIQKEAQVNYTNLPKVNGIPLLLHQLFYNLVNNALKFSTNDITPIVNITAERIEKTDSKKGKPTSFIHITIKDNGIGFSPEYAERIFNVFSRLNAKEKYEGTGLGLALCRKIVHRHQGEIYAESEEGKGATFHVWLPVKI